MKEKDSKILVLLIQSGFGKTQAIKAFLLDYNTLLLKEINALKHLKLDNKALILDDLD